MERKLGILFAIVLTLGVAQAQTTQKARDYYNSAAVHFRASEFELALADFNKSLELDPSNAEALFYRIMTLKQLDSKSEPINDYDRIIELAPHYRLIHVIYQSRANYRAGRSQFDGCINDLNKAIALTPEDGSAFHLRSFCYLGKNAMDEAYTDYKKSVELKTRLQNPLLTWGYAYKMKGRFDLALDTYNRALEWKPDDAIAYVDRGTNYVLMGNVASGLADIKKGLDIDPVSVTERAVEGFGCPFCSLNIYVQRLPNDARVYEARGLLRLLQHRESDAKDEFEKALGLMPQLKAEIDAAAQEIRRWQ